MTDRLIYVEENLNEFFNRFKSLIDYANRLDESDREIVVDSLNSYLNSDSELLKKTNLLLTDIKDNMSFKEVLKNIDEKSSLYNRYDATYNSSKNVNGAESILKHDTYDVNLLDNMYLTYYLLSFFVMGFTIFKLMK